VCIVRCEDDLVAAEAAGHTRFDIVGNINVVGNDNGCDTASDKIIDSAEHVEDVVAGVLEGVVDFVQDDEQVDLGRVQVVFEFIDELGAVPTDSGDPSIRVECF